MEGGLNFEIPRTITSVHKIHAITSVIRDFRFFVAEKWRIASAKGGSGNTANIGSITYIPVIEALVANFVTHIQQEYHRQSTEQLVLLEPQLYCERMIS